MVKDTDYILGFPPEKVFETCYLDLLSRCEKLCEVNELVNDVREEFLRIAVHNRQCGKSSTTAHAEAIHMQKSIYNSFIDRVCSFCLIGNSDQMLECRHELCNHCLVLLGQSSELHRFMTPSCPSCGMSATTTSSFRPPTAGTRTLNLEGHTRNSLWHFLKDLQQSAGLNSMPLKEHFDIIYGAETGIYSLRLS